jgi:hypothetical protein
MNKKSYKDGGKIMAEYSNKFDIQSEIIEGLRFVLKNKDCEDRPNQYYVFDKNGKQVAYIRMPSITICCYYPEDNKKNIYAVWCHNSGIKYGDEHEEELIEKWRCFHLKKIAKRIKREIIWQKILSFLHIKEKFYEKEEITIKGFRLVLHNPTHSNWVQHDCYEVFDKNNKEVAYIKLRHGQLRCFYRDITRWKVIYNNCHVNLKWIDGVFDDDMDRYHYLNKLVNRIKHRITWDKLTNIFKKNLKIKQYAYGDEKIIRGLKFVICKDEHESYDVFTKNNKEIAHIFRARAGYILCFYGIGSGFPLDGEGYIIADINQNPKMEKRFYNDEERYYYLNKLAKCINWETVKCRFILIRKFTMFFNRIKAFLKIAFIRICRD